MKKLILYTVLCALAVSFSACAKKAADSPGQNGEADAITVVDTPESRDEKKPQDTAPPVIAPKVTVEESQAIAREQEKVVEKAKKQEAAAQKALTEKVVTSSVVESAPIPDGFPVQNVPVIPGAQIASASKNGNRYEMRLRVNVSAADAYKHYFELYDALGSVKIVSKTEGAALSVERAKSGLKADFTFSNESENVSLVTMKVTDGE